MRAIVWWVTGNVRTATRVAVASGSIVAFLFVLGGLFLLFNGAFISGVWLILIGWFLRTAADASGRESQTTDWLRGITVGRVMNPRPATVGPGESVFQLVHEHILRRSVRALPVVEGDRLVGMVTLNEARDIPREQWDTTPVRTVMIGVDGLRTVRPEQDLTTALSLLAEHDINQMPVVEDGRLVGLLSRGNVIRYIEVREELGTSLEEGDEGRRAA